jgi:hypothetical protein
MIHSLLNVAKRRDMIRDINHEKVIPKITRLEMEDAYIIPKSLGRHVELQTNITMIWIVLMRLYIG